MFLSYNPNYDSFVRVDEVINWYNKFDLDFLCLYFDEPDSTGHKFGPDSKEYMEKVLINLNLCSTYNFFLDWLYGFCIWISFKTS